MTADGVLVAFHDVQTLRATGISGIVSQLTYSELQQLNAANFFCRSSDLTGITVRCVHESHSDTEQQIEEFCSAPHAIPTLEQVVHTAQELDLLLIMELKHGVSISVGKRVAELYQKYPLLYDTGVVLSFYPWLLYAVRAADSRIPVVSLFSKTLLQGHCPRLGSNWRRICVAASVIDPVIWYHHVLYSVVLLMVTTGTGLSICCRGILGWEASHQP